MLPNLLNSSLTIIKSTISIKLQKYSCKSNKSVTKLIYSKYGPPEKVIEIVHENLSDPKPNEVVLKMLAAPVNPADINTIQGVYPTKPKLPAVPGFEGVGEVIAVGTLVKELKLKDRVVPLVETLGTWRTYAKYPERLLLKIPENLDTIQAATMTINPPTAYRMLKDFENLRLGDVVIQNGANSSVGQNVIQIAKKMGLRTVNIVRNRPTIEDLKTKLKDIGATIILTEEELATTEIFKKQLPKPKLALNCVGGKSASQLMKQLAEGGTMVTYGGMSREPVTVSIPSLIFKDVQVRGFWVTLWNKEKFRSKEWHQMFKDLMEMMNKKQIKVPDHNLIPFTDYKEALEKTLSPQGREKKFILQF